jgi:hypothetical protein
MRTIFASFSVSQNCQDYERSEFRETTKIAKTKKTIFLLILVKMTAKVAFGNSKLVL